MLPSVIFASINYLYNLENGTAVTPLSVVSFCRNMRKLSQEQAQFTPSGVENI